MRGLKVAVVVMGLAAASPGWAAATCDSLPSHGEQATCLQRQLGAQALQMKKLVETRIRRIVPEDFGDETQRDAYVQTIRRAQTAWESYRDTECDELGFVMMRHIVLAVNGCKAELNAARLVALRKNMGP